MNTSAYDCYDDVICLADLFFFAVVLLTDVMSQTDVVSPSPFPRLSLESIDLIRVKSF